MPGFYGLVKKIYEILGDSVELNSLEKYAFDRSQFDITLNLLEQRLPGGRIEMRKALAEALELDLTSKEGAAINTHDALLKLARSDDKKSMRLVTTNFDLIFEYVANKNKQAHTIYAAPELPIPKDNRWNGLVYLHGILPEKPYDDAELSKLVITSGDFGLAYLIERWAARFVSELFRNYVVCFIGYSINDLFWSNKLRRLDKRQYVNYRGVYESNKN